MRTGVPVERRRHIRVIQLAPNPGLYTCRSYLVLGDWNAIDDVNTLIDPGTDGYVLDEIEKTSTGFGKVPVEQIIITHNHFDHSGAAAEIKARYGAPVYAFTEMKGVDALLHDGQLLRAGDDYLEVVHSPGHSSDSISLYCQAQRLLFSGDTQLRIHGTDGMYTSDFVKTLVKLASRKIETVYPGHDDPMTSHVRHMINETLRNVRNSQVVP